MPRTRSLLPGAKRPESVEDGHSYHSVSHRVSFCMTINPTSVMATILATWCPGRPAGQRLLSRLQSRRGPSPLLFRLSLVGSRMGRNDAREMMTCISHIRNPSCIPLPLPERAFFCAAVNARVLALVSYTLRTLCRVAIMDISNMLRLGNTRPRMGRAVSVESGKSVRLVGTLLSLSSLCRKFWRQLNTPSIGREGRRCESSIS